MDKIKEIRIREKDGSLSDILPIGANAKNVEMANGNSVEDEINNKASKVELKTLETKVNNMVDITPIPVSSVEEMTDTSKIYVNTTDGHWYSYNGTEWVDGGVYQATEIEDESITKSKLNFLIRNKKQLFNKDIIIRNSYVSKDNGQIYTVHPNNPQNKYNAGDWIELEYNMCLIFTKLTEEQQYAFYDENKNFISGAKTNGQNPIIQPDDAKYIRFTVMTSDLNTFNLCYGGVPSKNEYLILNEKDNEYVKKIRNEESIFNIDEDFLHGWHCGDDGVMYPISNPIYKGMTNFIPLKYGESIVANDVFAFICEFDEKGRFVANTFTQDNKQFTPTNENCKYVRIILYSSNYKNISFKYGTEIPNEYLPYYFPNIENNTISLDMLNEEVKKFIEAKTSNNLRNKKITFLGDSITFGRNGANDTYEVDKPYPTIISEKTGCISTNMGVCGSTIGGDQTTIDGKLNGYRPINERIKDVNADSDYLIIFAGTNDFGSGDAQVELGTIDDEPSHLTVYASLKKIFNYYYDNFNTTKIGFVLPLQRTTMNANNSFGYKLKEYINAIKEVCELYSIPYLDLYNSGGCYPLNENWKNNNLPDGLHPNQKFYYDLADKIIGFITAL